MQFLLAAGSGGLVPVVFVALRVYLGWAYVGNRLLSAVVEYEETGWCVPSYQPQRTKGDSGWESSSRGRFAHARMLSTEGYTNAAKVWVILSFKGLRCRPLSVTIRNFFIAVQLCRCTYLLTDAPRGDDAGTTGRSGSSRRRCCRATGC